LDNITHGLMGLAIGMLRRRDGGPERDRPLSPTDKAVTLATFAAAELPDVDIFFGKGPMAGLEYHRGWTHALVAAPALALVAAVVAKLIWRKARFGTVYAWSLGSIFIAHLLNDWFTGWGTRLLLPWSEARVGLDWIPIVDLLYTVPLLAAVIMAWRRPTMRQKAALSVMLYLAAYAVGFRGLTHTITDGAVAERYTGQAVQKSSLSPSIFNPLAWTYAKDLGDRYEVGTAYPWGVREPQIIAKAPQDQVIRAVRNAPELQPFFAQFRFPVMTYKAAGDGYQVSLADVRYQMRGRGMSYAVKLRSDLTVLEVSESGW